MPNKTMKNPSKKTLYLLLIGAALLLVIVIQRSPRRSNAPKTGRFEQVYTTAIDSLHDSTKTVREKLRANLPGDLEILPEKRLRHSKTNEKEEDEDPGEPTLKNITLRGIYWSDAMPLAEINDRLCKTGDQIAGFILEEIQPYQIILTDDLGNRHTNSLVREL